MKDNTVNKTLKPDPRSKANIEAEKSETIVTNTGLDNLPEQFTIAGKKHVDGGTPLDAAKDSFIFSMNKDMKIADKSLLQFFGETGKKPLIPGEIAKKYDVNDMKKKLKDPNIDKITKDSIERSYEGALSKLSALAIVQESLKGTPQGYTPMFEKFMDKARLTPEQLIGISPEESQSVMAPQKNAFGGNVFAHGGSVNMFDIPVYADGGPVKKEDLTTEQKKEIVDKWNGQTDKYISFLNTKSSILNNDKLLSDLQDQYNNVIDNPKNYTSEKYLGYKDALKGRSKEEIATELLKQEERNAILDAYGQDVSKWSQQVQKGTRTNKEMNTFLQQHPELKSTFNFDRGHVGQAAYLAFDDLMNTDKYKGSKTNEFQTGTGDESRGSISGIDNANTNTTLGQRLNYTSPAEKKIVTPDATPVYEKTPIVPDYIDSIASTNNRPIDYLWADKKNIALALGERAGIKKYSEFTPNPDVFYTQHAYDSPDAKVNAISSQLAQGVQGQNAFGTPQSQAANFQQMQGNAFNQAAQIIDQVSTNNQNAFNSEKDINTQIANQAAGQQANNAERSHDKRVILSQAFDNAINASNQKIGQNMITAWNNRKDIFNVQQMSGEQYNIDPNTGFIKYSGVGRELKPTVSNGKDYQDTYNELSRTMVGVSPDIIAKAALAIHSGKYAMIPDENNIPNSQS